MNRRALLLGALALASATAGTAEALEIHFAPVENLERIGVALIDGAENTIDMAAYLRRAHQYREVRHHRTG